MSSALRGILVPAPGNGMFLWVPEQDRQSHIVLYCPFYHDLNKKLFERCQNVEMFWWNIESFVLLPYFLLNSELWRQVQLVHFITWTHSFFLLHEWHTKCREWQLFFSSQLLSGILLFWRSQLWCFPSLYLLKMIGDLVEGHVERPKCWVKIRSSVR